MRVDVSERTGMRLKNIVPDCKHLHETFRWFAGSSSSKNTCAEPCKAFLVFVKRVTTKGKEPNKDNGGGRNRPPQDVVGLDDNWRCEESRIQINTEPIGMDIGPIRP